MLKQPLAVLLAAVVMATVAFPVAGAHAQQEVKKYDNLKRLLERKFTPAPAQQQNPAVDEGGTRALIAPPKPAVPTPSAAPAPQTTGTTRSLMLEPAPATRSMVQAPVNAAVPKPAPLKRAFNWLKVKNPAAKDPAKTNSPADAGKRGDVRSQTPAMLHADASWFAPVSAYIFEKLSGNNQQSAGAPSAKQVAALSVMTGDAGMSQSVAATRATDPANAAIELAQDSGPAAAPSTPPPAEVEVPVLRRNSYVIQLKPDASEVDIGKLLEKYNLNVTKVIGELGVITVESNDDNGGRRGIDGPSAGPESEAPSTPEEAKQQLNQMLEPPLIKDLRKEGIVDAAIVNSTIGTKGLPRPSGAALQGGGKTYEWSWGPSQTADGNWGLKAIRMPAVWGMVDRYRKAHPDVLRPKVGVIDLGFTSNPNVKFQSVYGTPAVTVLRPDCSTHHGMHVAGIIGAKQGDTPGIDGMVPDARIDAIGISNQAGSEAGSLGVDQLWELQTLVFDEVLSKTMDYLVDNLEHPDNLRVINISLGYNFLAKRLVGSDSLDGISGLKLHIHHQASILRTMAQRVEGKVLFVVAAGNDSEGRSSPLEARWSSPFAWAGTYEGGNDKPAKNILVVEAIGRDGQRADFSNIGGHLSAPGVDIMSTLAGSGPASFGVCSGTSQAAPHVAALAALMFELDPTKKPADIVAALKASATPPPPGSAAAPAIDALEAVLALSRANGTLLADLDGDGIVGPADLIAFKRQSAEIEAAATTNTAFTDDLNGDGVVNDNECYWPSIDLNGSGAATPFPTGMKRVAGLFRSDLQTLNYAWPTDGDTFETALAQSGITLPPPTDAVASEPSKTATPVFPAQCRGTVTVATEAVPAPSPATSQQPVPPSPPATVIVAGKDGGATAPAEATAPAPPLTVIDTAPVHTAENLVAEPSAVRDEVKTAIEALRSENPKLRVIINPATGLPSSISGFTPKADANGAGVTRSANGPSDEDVRRIVEGFFANGGLASAVGSSRAFATRNRQAITKMIGRARDPDFPDRTIATVEQQVDGIPVFGSTGKLTLDQLGGVSKYTGTASQVAIEDIKPKLEEADAIEAARGKLRELIKGGHDLAPMPLSPKIATAAATAKLTVFDPAIINKRSKGATRLAYLVTIETFRLFVDGKTGEVFYYYRDQPTGMLRRIYDLGRSTVFPGTKVADEETREIAENLTPDSSVAFQNGGVVRDYFFMLFGRDGYDDNDGPAGPNGGSVLESYVRYGSLSNAYWCPVQSYSCPKANVMVYGPGYAEAIDIVGHEITHGIISHEKNLLYLNESGAVNESLADIFGTLIEQYVRIPRANWVIGETLPGFSENTPMRSMADPNLKDRDGKSMFNREVRYSMSNRGQPDRYADVLTPLDPLCAKTRMQDNGCVHFNSGILNKFAYLISEGGTHYGIIVTGIGRIKLARLAYRTMTAQLNQSSDLTEAAEGFMQSCVELAEAGKGGLTSDDCAQVGAAQQAVGLVLGSS